MHDPQTTRATVAAADHPKAATPAKPSLYQTAAGIVEAATADGLEGWWKNEPLLESHDSYELDDPVCELSRYLDEARNHWLAEKEAEHGTRAVAAAPDRRLPPVGNRHRSTAHPSNQPPGDERP